MREKQKHVFQLSFTLAVLSLLPLSGAAWGQSATITASNFGMQCGNGTSTNCPNYTLPEVQAKPGLLRLISANVYWAQLEPPSFSGCVDVQQVAGVDTYCWDTLDSWLDAIAGNSYIQAVDYVFLGIPCQLSDPSECGTGGSSDPNGLNYPPPNDLGSSGSASFNNFVTQLTQHCSKAGNCVANIIKYYEMWNEPNGQYWYDGGAGGSEVQLEDMVFPARNIIWSNVPNAIVMTPGWAGSNPQTSTWIQDWLDAESANGTHSNAVAFHNYLNNAPTPEQNYVCYIAASTSSAPSTCDNPGKPSLLYMMANTPGWSTTPWLDTETNFAPSTFACSLSDTADCTGQIVRWQLLQDASGAASVDWFYWNTTIGGNSNYEPAYYYMMQHLEGGQFTSTCSNTTGTIWNCPFTDTNGNTDLWVWATNETAQSYSTSYSDYWTVAGSGAGTCTTIPANFTVTVEPYLLTNSCTGVTPPSFIVSSSTSAQTVQPGGVATYTITVTPQNGAFTNPVVLTASGLPTGATASFSPANVTPGGSAANSTLTIQISNAVAMKVGLQWPFGASALAGLALFFLPGKRRRRWIALGVLFFASLGTVTSLTGCGGSAAQTTQSPSGPMSYTITVTATSGADQLTTTVELTVE